LARPDWPANILKNMSPLNKETILSKIERLERNSDILDGYKKLSEPDFFNDYTIHGAAMHYLVESIEIIIDAGSHILSECFEKSPATYKDIVLELGNEKIVPFEFSTKNAEMADFRNLIIHGYASIDLNEVYQSLQKAPDIFRQFAKYYIDFLEKASEK